MLNHIQNGKYPFKYTNTWIFLNILAGFLLLSSSIATAQKLNTKSKKAEKLYYEAQTNISLRAYDIAIPLLEEAVGKDEDFIEAQYMLGVSYKFMFRSDKAKPHLEKANQLNAENKIPGINFHLGEIYFKEERYEETKVLMERFLSSNPKGYNRDVASDILVNCEYAVEGIKNKVNFNPVPLPRAVNRFQLQYFPVLSVDQSMLFYTRRLGISPSDDEDLVVSFKNSDGVWNSPVSVSDNINTRYNEGTCTISADGRIIIFTSCFGRSVVGSCDLFMSFREGNDWSEPVNLGPPVNSKAWESQPALSPDGRTLYFVSDRGGGYGKRDIWMTTLNDENEWTTPVNLGPRINSGKDDISPFIHANGQTLYFASQGQPGFGGYDIYYTELTEDGWSIPENMGYPINTSDDQVSLFITADGSKGYYSHEESENGQRLEGKIYEFDIPEEIRVTNRSNYVSGRVFDAATKKQIKADIELFDLAKQARISKVQSDRITGQYMMVLTEGSEYALYVNKTGYLFQSLSFNYLEDVNLDPINIDIYLEPITEGIKTTLNNIFFDFDEYELKEKSITELKEVNKFLENNPSLKIEISGHTDNKGNDTYNNELSLKRAKAVYDYLLTLGVTQSRMTYKGYGANEPVASNETEEGQALNRRIEFKVVTR